MPKSMLMLTLILIAGFKTCNGTKPNVLTKSSITMNKPTTSTQTLAERPTFASDIRPILQSRCQPCHFQGGQMYEKLPFDKPETITKLWPASGALIDKPSFQRDPPFMARSGGRRERIVNALRSALEQKDERSRAAAHKSETPVPVHRARPGPARALPWGACA